MSNIERLRDEELAARLTWQFGDDALPLRSNDPTSLAADAVRQADERIHYARAALRGDADTLGDALRFNEDRTIRMVARLAQLDSSPSMSGDEFRVAYRLLLSDLIHAAAAGHADACERNGWPL